jgi:TRAP-type C4-dicarboxylate transport system permease large subunit
MGTPTRLLCLHVSIRSFSLLFCLMTTQALPLKSVSTRALCGVSISKLPNSSISAAVGAFSAILLAIGLRRLTFHMLRNSLLSTIKISAMVFLIVAGSNAFSQILAVSNATRGLAQIVVGLNLSPLVVLVLLQLIPFILGCFIDQYSIR